MFTGKMSLGEHRHLQSKTPIKRDLVNITLSKVEYCHSSRFSLISANGGNMHNIEIWWAICDKNALTMVISDYSRRQGKPSYKEANYRYYVER